MVRTVHCECQRMHQSRGATEMQFFTLTACWFFSPYISCEHKFEKSCCRTTIMMVEAVVDNFSKDFCFISKYFLLLFEHFFANLMLACFLLVKITDLVQLKVWYKPIFSCVSSCTGLWSWLQYVEQDVLTSIAVTAIRYKIWLQLL